MVLDATIRPSGQVGLQPGAGLKRFTLFGQPDVSMHGIVYAALAVVLHRVCTLVLEVVAGHTRLAVSTPSRAGLLIIP
jgi:hypothetical protein